MSSRDLGRLRLCLSMDVGSSPAPSENSINSETRNNDHNQKKCQLINSWSVDNHSSGSTKFSRHPLLHTSMWQSLVKYILQCIWSLKQSKMIIFCQSRRATIAINTSVSLIDKLELQMLCYAMLCKSHNGIISLDYQQNSVEWGLIEFVGGFGCNHYIR
jgi:hypothetical protein